jgi:hypothetical protein
MNYPVAKMIAQRIWDVDCNLKVTLRWRRISSKSAFSPLKWFEFTIVTQEALKMNEKEYQVQLCILDTEFTTVA